MEILEVDYYGQFRPVHAERRKSGQHVLQLHQGNENCSDMLSDDVKNCLLQKPKLIKSALEQQTQPKLPLLPAKKSEVGGKSLNSLNFFRKIAAKNASVNCIKVNVE